MYENMPGVARFSVNESSSGCRDASGMQQLVWRCVFQNECLAGCRAEFAGCRDLMGCQWRAWNTVVALTMTLDCSHRLVVNTRCRQKKKRILPCPSALGVLLSRAR